MKKKMVMAIMIGASLFVLAGCGVSTGETGSSSSVGKTENSADSKETKEKEENETSGSGSTDELITYEDTEGKYVISCVGDSITYGITVDGNGEVVSTVNYPEILDGLFGDGYAVLNFGKRGTCVTSGERFTYRDQEEYERSMESDADMFIIMLGTNDSNANTWNEDSFREDYSELLDTYLEAFPEAAIYTMTPPCAYNMEESDTAAGGVQPEVLDAQIAPEVKAISEEKGIPVIDLHEYTRDHEDWFRDGVQPDDEGYEIIAEYIYNVISSAE